MKEGELTEMLLGEVNDELRWVLYPSWSAHALQSRRSGAGRRPGVHFRRPGAQAGFHARPGGSRPRRTPAVPARCPRSLRARRRAVWCGRTTGRSRSGPRHSRGGGGAGACAPSEQPEQRTAK